MLSANKWLVKIGNRLEVRSRPGSQTDTRYMGSKRTFDEATREQINRRHPLSAINNLQIKCREITSMTGKYCLPSDSPDETPGQPVQQYVIRLAKVTSRSFLHGAGSAAADGLLSPGKLFADNSKLSKGDAALVQFAPRLPRGKKTDERNTTPKACRFAAPSSFAQFAGLLPLFACWTLRV